jgi:hypothetical protein
MTTIKAMRLASLVTAINVLVASGFSIAAIFRPEAVVPAGSTPTEASLLLAMYAAARTIPLALFALAAIYKRATSALLILGALAGAMQLLDAGIGLLQHDLGKFAGPLFIAVLQFFAGVSASQIRADHAVDQARMNAPYVKRGKVAAPGRHSLPSASTLLFLSLIRGSA